jgi:WhiB family redox-sensing transcriptional regulator
MMNATWKAKGACHGMDPNIFFPEKEKDSGEAIAICRPCPVRPICLEYAIEHRVKDGVWGGMTDKERQKLARQRRVS